MTKAKYQVGDYVVNHNGSVGIIKELTERGFEGEWYSGGDWSCEMVCSEYNFVRYAEMDDIMTQLPFNMRGSALLELEIRRQKEEREAEMGTKYKVGDYVLNHTGVIVGLIERIENGRYYGQWFEDGQATITGMNCENNAIERIATLSEVKEHVPHEVFKFNICAEEEVAMTTIDVDVLEALKAVVTEEEGKALDAFISWNSHRTPEQKIAKYVEQSKTWTDEYKPLHEMGVEKFVRAILNGYKLDAPTINVGDKVVYVGPSGGMWEGAATVISTGKATNRVNDGKNDHYAFPYNLRHATEEEVIWSALGREVGEFRIGDRYVGEEGLLYHIENEGNRVLAGNRYRRAAVYGLLPKESYVSFMKGGNA